MTSFFPVLPKMCPSNNNCIAVLDVREQQERQSNSPLWLVGAQRLYRDCLSLPVPPAVGQSRKHPTQCPMCCQVGRGIVSIHCPLCRHSPDLRPYHLLPSFPSPRDTVSFRLCLEGLNRFLYRCCQLPRSCGFLADTRWVRSHFSSAASKPEGREKLTVFSALSVVLSRFWERLRHRAGPETGLALAKLRWIRTRVTRKKRPGRDRRGRSSLSAWFGPSLPSAVLGIFAIHF